MWRTLAGALLIAVIASAHAQTPRPQPQQPIPQQQPLPPATPRIQTYTYTATTAAPVRRSGNVAALGITWSCSATACTVAGPWPAPGVPACAALAREVGRIVSYGRPGATLNATQLGQCNAAPAPTPPAPPPPPPPPPPDPGIMINTPEVSVIGGSVSAAEVIPEGATITTGELSVRGGADAGPPVIPLPATITTPELSVVGRTGD